MTTSQPKFASLFAVIFFMLIVLAVDVWIVMGLINNPQSYFIAKLILAPLLFVIAIMVGVKSYFSAIAISLGSNKISYKYPLGSKREYALKAISNWTEDIVKRSGTEYRQLSIRLTNGKKLKISNHENTNYGQVISYLKKKVKQS